MRESSTLPCPDEGELRTPNSFGLWAVYSYIRPHTAQRWPSIADTRVLVGLKTQEANFREILAGLECGSEGQDFCHS